MKKPAEFLQGFGIGVGLIAVVAAISLLSRPATTLTGPAREASAGTPAVEPRGAGDSAAILPPDYLDLCREAGL
jgi:hypothetical protein